MDTINLELTVNEINVILQGLSELPFKAVADLFNKIHIQSNAAMAAKQQSPVEAEVVSENEEAPTINSRTGNK